MDPYSLADSSNYDADSEQAADSSPEDDSPAACGGLDFRPGAVSSPKVTKGYIPPQPGSGLRRYSSTTSGEEWPEEYPFEDFYKRKKMGTVGQSPRFHREAREGNVGVRIVRPTDGARGIPHTAFNPHNVWQEIQYEQEQYHHEWHEQRNLLRQQEKLGLSESEVRDASIILDSMKENAAKLTGRFRGAKRCSEPKQHHYARGSLQAAMELLHMLSDSADDLSDISPYILKPNYLRIIDAMREEIREALVRQDRPVSRLAKIGEHMAEIAKEIVDHIFYHQKLLGGGGQRPGHVSRFQRQLVDENA